MCTSRLENGPKPPSPDDQPGLLPLAEPMMNLTAAAYAGLHWVCHPRRQNKRAHWWLLGMMLTCGNAAGGRASLSRTTHGSGACWPVCMLLSCCREQPTCAHQHRTREQTLSPDNQPGLLPLAGANDEPDSGRVCGPALGVLPKETKRTCIVDVVRQDDEQQTRRPDQQHPL